MLGLLNLNSISNFFGNNSENNNVTSDNLSLENLEKINSKKILDLKHLIVELENFLPTNLNHLNPSTPNHLEEIKILRNLISNIKKSLLPCFNIIKKTKSNNFNLHDSITACDMILGLLQIWDKNKILSGNETKSLNKVLVIFSKNMHDVLTEIKF